MSEIGEKYLIEDFMMIADSTVKQVVEPSVNGLFFLGLNEVDYLSDARWAVMTGRVGDSDHDLSIYNPDPFCMNLTYRVDIPSKTAQPISHYSRHSEWLEFEGSNSQEMLDESAMVVAEWIGKQIDNE